MQRYPNHRSDPMILDAEEKMIGDDELGLDHARLRFDLPLTEWKKMGQIKIGLSLRSRCPTEDFIPQS